MSCIPVKAFVEVNVDNFYCKILDLLREWKKYHRVLDAFQSPKATERHRHITFRILAGLMSSFFRILIVANFFFFQLVPFFVRNLSEEILVKVRREID